MKDHKCMISFSILIVFTVSVSWANGRLSSPGDSVGWTKYDLQRDGGPIGCQVWYDAARGTHVDFMEAHGPDPFPDRGCTYNFNLDGVWYGAMQANSERAGYVALGVKPSNNAGVCIYHMVASGDIYRFWVAVDEGGQGGYAFIEKPGLPQITSGEGPIWPRMAIDDHGNFHVVCHSRVYETILYTRSTDDGDTWEDTTVLYYEPGGAGRNISGDVFADRFNSPGKVINYWTQWTGDGIGGHAQHSQDIYYRVSTNYGETWGPKINLTNYQPSDTFRAFCHSKAIFDRNGDFHIIFPVLKFINPTAYYKSWIIHWSPITGFSFVTGPHEMTNYPPGAWRLPCDHSNIALDRDNGWLYCIYILCRDSDVSQNGHPNGEIMAKYSTDNGYTWISNAVGDTGVNLTKTHTPNAPPGECCDDDYPSLHPYVETVNGEKCLIISYVEDKDAGAYMHGEGIETDNPYRVYFCPCESIIKVEEEEPRLPVATQLLNVAPNPTRDFVRINYTLKNESEVKIDILDITGRLVANLVNQVVKAGHHTVSFKPQLPAGVYFVLMETENYQTTKRFVVIK